LRCVRWVSRALRARSVEVGLSGLYGLSGLCCMWLWLSAVGFPGLWGLSCASVVLTLVSTGLPLRSRDCIRGLRARVRSVEVEEIRLDFRSTLKRRPGRP
jgi:hypothetical protein